MPISRAPGNAWTPLSASKEKGTVMEASKRKALEAAGWKMGDSADFLDLSAGERQLLDARVKLALAIRHQRESQNLSQKELGERLKTSQPRIAKIERAASDVSLDQLVRAFTAAGGKMVVKSVKSKSRKKGPNKLPGQEPQMLELTVSQE